MYYYIEHMGEHDVEQVHAVERQCYDVNWSLNTYRRELRQPDSRRYLVARASPTLPPPRQERHASPLWGTGLLRLLFAPFFAPDQSPNPHEIVGYGGIWVTVDEGHITTIAVAPAHRGRAIGELLLNGLIDQALELGAANLTLEVRVSNTVAQNLYHKYGFSAVGRRKHYYTDNNEDALIMWTDRITSAEYQALLREHRQQLYTRLRRTQFELVHT
jgi:ribosomal-protein-alanine N-acetyltransferase